MLKRSKKKPSLRIRVTKEDGRVFDFGTIRTGKFTGPLSEKLVGRRIQKYKEQMEKEGT